MIKKIDHFVITTSNMKKCMDFYKGLGFKVMEYESRGELYAGDFKINVHYLNRELSPHATNIQVGSADICFEIEDNIQNFKQLLESKGYVIYTDVVERSGVRGDMNSVYLYDPDGNLLEFSEY